MRTISTKLAVAGAVAAGAVLLLPTASAIAAPARPAAAGCSYLARTYTSGSSNYAVVGNNCGYTISAHPKVPFLPDPACASIGAHGTRTFRTGGSFSDYADGTTQC